MGCFLEFYCTITSNFSLGQAQSPGMLMLSGFFLGIGGAIFSVGVTCTQILFKRQSWFSKCIYGVGNIGTAVSSFVPQC